MADPIVGVDLGTTHSLVAVYEETGPRVLVGELGSALIPSVVAVDDGGRLLVGAPAAERLVSHPASAVARFKPDMGSPQVRMLGEHRLTPTSLSALVLRELKAMAEAALGTAVRDVVVTVPAWFREPQRRATLDAAQVAGLQVRHLLNEPTAAALAYGLGQEEVEQTVVVVDLGGGTFDVTVLELFEGVVDVRASTGDVHLGGEDFTDAVLAELVGARKPDPAARSRLRHRVEAARRALSTEQAVDIDLQDIGLPPRRLTREEIEAWCRPLLARVKRCLREALLQAGVRAPEITDVLLVGGATRMPAVGEAAREALGRPPRFVQHVDELVAMGAAVQAALLRRHAGLRERVVTDVLTHSLGVATQQQFGGEVFNDRFHPLLARGAALPAARTERFWTTHPEQRAITLRVYEGEHRTASSNELIGTLEVGDLTAHPKDSDQREAIDIRFAQDSSGLLEVSVVIPSTGKAASLQVERTARPLSPEARAAAEAELARLRTHPRDALPNRFLLERAGRLVSMLVGHPRIELDAQLTAFEAALEREDLEVISTLRAALTARCDQLAAEWGLDLP